MAPTALTSVVSRSSQSGQAAVFVVLAMGVFLLGAIAFAVDLSNLWMHRQMSQNAADAACTAAAMDMVSDYPTVATPPAGGFTPGTPFLCSGHPSYAPCKYAEFNGYKATAGGLTAGAPSTEVSVDFPASVPGIQSCTGVTPPPSVCTSSGVPANAFVRVTVTDRMQTFFLGLLSGGTTMDVGAKATCGAVLANSPIPILVLDPRNESSVDNNGNFTIQIVGGPQRSIQVNSPSSSAVSIAGASGIFDLSHGGPFSPPATQGSGSDFGVTGTEAATNYNGGTKGSWISPTGPISDPFATLPAPTNPGAPVVPADVSGAPANCTSTKISQGNCQVGPGVHGCPLATGTCTLYTGGAYTSGITVGQGSLETAIFDPGTYYITGGNFDLRSNSCVRPSTSAGDGSGGTMFYFADNHSVTVNSNSGAAGKCPAALVPLDRVRCITSGTGTTILPANVISFGGLAGNVLLGPCKAPSAGGTNYGDPLGANDPLGEQRGMLFFQNRDSTGVVGTWDGGGSFGLAGMMYFHSCHNGVGNGGGANCDTTSGYTDNFHLQGGSCSSTFVIGDIVTDKLHLGGNPCIEMDLNPNALYYVLKASLLE